MTYKLILFDYNGTIVNTPFIDGKPLHILPGVREKINTLSIQGVYTDVCTNQGGPAWNMATGKDKFPTTRAVALEMLRIMVALSGVLTRERHWYISLYDSRVMGMLKARYELEQLVAPEEVMKQLQKAMEDEFGRVPYVHVGIEKDWRKPAPGMLLAAMKHANVGPAETLYVGDLPDDEEAAKNAGVAFQWSQDFFATRMQVVNPLDVFPVEEDLDSDEYLEESE